MPSDSVIMLDDGPSPSPSQTDNFARLRNLPDGAEVPDDLISARTAPQSDSVIFLGPPSYRSGASPTEGDLSSAPDGSEIASNQIPAPQLRQLIASDPWFPITHDIAKTLYQDDQRKSLLQKAGEFIRAIPGGVKQVGQQIAEAHNEMKNVPFPGTQREVERLANTITEAGAEGALNTIGLARRAWLNFRDTLAEKLGGATDEEKIDDYLKELLLRQKVERQARGLPDERPANYDPSQPSFVLKGFGNSPPYPHAAQVLSLPLDPAFLATSGAAGAAGRLAGAALRSVPAGAKAMEILDAAKSLPGRAVVAGLKGIEKAGQTASDAAAYPIDATAEKLSTILPESAKGAADSLAHIAGPGSVFAALSGHGGPVTAAIALLKGTEWSGLIVRDTAGFFRRLAETSGDSAVPRLVQLAANPDAPQWIQIAAGKLDSLGIGKAARFAADLGESGLHGGSIGAGLSAAAGDSPQEAGQAAGAGFGLGVAGRGFRKFAGSDAIAQRIAATVGARQRFYEYLRNDLQMPEDQIVKVDDFTAATLGHARDILGTNKLNLRFYDPADAKAAAAAQGEAGGAAWFDPSTGTVNLTLGDNTGRELHELPHAILQAAGADGEARLMIDSVFSPDQLQAFGREYAARLAKTNDPAAVQQKVNELNQRWNGDNWIVNELYAEAGYGGFFASASKRGQHFMQDIVGVNRTIWDRLGDRARALFLNNVGDFFDPETGKPSVPRGAIFSDPEIYNNGKLRRLVFEHLRGAMRLGGEIRKGKDEAAPVAVPANLIGKHPAAPKAMLKENGIFFENAKGELQPAPRLAAKLDREKTKQVQQAIVNQPVKPKGDTSPEVAPRISSTGEKEVTGSKIVDQLQKLPAYGDWAKKVAAFAEELMGTGKAMRTWYFPVGEGFPWRRSVARNAGDLPAKQIDLAPFEFRIDNKSHVLVTGLSISAADRKIARWKQEGKLDALWNGDAGQFRADLMTYLKNHAEGKPGAEVIGENKRNSLNVFLIGKQAKLADLNPLRSTLIGEDKQGIIRSLRLDRIATVDPSQHEGWQAEYAKKRINYAPANELIQFSPASEAGADDKTLARAKRAWEKQGTRSPFFRKWFGASKVVDEDHKPLVVYHGTTHSFDAFSQERSNPENDLGVGFYFSSDYSDAEGNYAGRGPDLTNRIDSRAEQIFQDLEDERGERFHYGSPEYKALMAEARDRAAAELEGPEPRTVAAYLKIANPLVIDPNGRGGTHFEYGFDEETGQETGSAVDLYDAIMRTAPEFGVDGQRVWDNVATDIDDLPAKKVIDRMKEAAFNHGEAYDEQGRSTVGEFVRSVFENLGFDGIIYNEPLAHFPRMNIGTGTKHYIVFQPEQVKGVENRGTFGTDKRYNFSPAVEDAEEDPNTGVLTLMSGDDLNFESAREAIHERALSQTVRECLADAIRIVDPKGTKRVSQRQLARDFARSTNDTPAKERAAAIMQLLLTMPESEFEKAAEPGSEIRSVAERLRAAIPLLSDNAPLIKATRSRRVRAPFELLGVGSEGFVVAVPGDAFAYKITTSNGGFSLSGATEGVRGLRLTIRPGTIFDSIIRLERQARLQTGLPAEIVGITRRGDLVVKLPRMEGEATSEDVDRWASKQRASFQRTSGEDVPADVVRDQPIIKDAHGNSYLVADLRREGRSYPNLLRDTEGRAFMADLMIRPITGEDVQANPSLRRYAPKAPEKILYSPIVEGGEQFEGVNFASPNVQENLSLRRALGRLRSATHASFKKRGDEIDAESQIQSKAASGLGDWSDGQEDSIMRTYFSTPSQEILRVVGARYGLAGDQKAVLTFTVNNEGNASLYKFTLPKSFGGLDAVRKYLSDHGVAFRTLLPRKDGIGVVIVDADGTLGEAMGQIADEQALDIEKYQGNAEFIGGNSRSEARRIYYAIIREAKRSNR